jgi:hypothetical protein
MVDNWYYVQNGNRQGPVGIEVITEMISKQELRDEDYVWKKGFENWKKIKEVSELQLISEVKSQPMPVPPVQMVEEKPFSFSSLDPSARVINIRIGNDRGEAPNVYGPFSINQLKQLFKENRINGKSFIFTTGMKEWMILADLPEYEEMFQELPPEIKEADRRGAARKPFIARLFIQNNKKLFEGVCRDISIGGMQILLDDFQGQAGDKITINVHPENSDYHFAASGVVVRILEGNSGFSFRFQGLSDEAKRAIEKYIQEN